MQTFLPYPDFARSARALDRKRLGKQRVETLQVVRALTRTDYGWQNHPAVLMWRGCEEALGRYGLECCAAWTDLGFDDTCALSIVTDLRAAGVASLRTQDDLAAAGALPAWLGDEPLHRSHRSALVRKDPGQLENLAGNPEYAEVQKKFRARLQEHLVHTKDPRALGLDAPWDYYPYYGMRRNKNWKVDPKP
ncbi:MSMEG_6728 family protein [uncultured Nocardioides sp.]|uniref:MSMEG_6728 family protein n=1 Tax=uncultured Nocardioides sp. TaxID=198441 RepID=UPI00261A2F71|nr:MSMEG_6728 family protein [uncultured Nocardioides sp.]